MSNNTGKIKLEVGQKIWIFDRERRIYDLPDGTHLTNSPWFRGHFVERYVVGETNIIYIFGSRPTTNPDDKRLTDRIKKSELKDGENIYTSEKSIDEACWVHDHWSEVNRKISNCNEYSKIIRILEILNEK